MRLGQQAIDYETKLAEITARLKATEELLDTQQQELARLQQASDR